MDLEEAVCFVAATLRSRPRGRSERAKSMPSRGTPRSGEPRAKLRARTAYQSSSRPRWVAKHRDSSHEEDDSGATRGAPAASSGAARGSRDARSRSRRRSPSARSRSQYRRRPYDQDEDIPLASDNAPGLARQYVDEETMEHWKSEGWSEHQIRHYISTRNGFPVTRRARSSDPPARERPCS